MFSQPFGKHVKIGLVVLVTLAFTAGSAAAIVINFVELPNEAGIHVTGDLDVTKLGSEAFRISAPGCVSIPACNPDATLNQIGTNDEFLVNILESAGGPISDQVWVHRLTDAPGSQVIDFHSDDGTPFVTGGPGAIVTTVVETGSLQPVLTYTSSAPAVVNISVLSDVDTVPGPPTLLLLGTALLSITVTRKAVAAYSRRASPTDRKSVV